MTLLTSLARALAAERGRAELIRTIRHVHLSPRPLVFVPLELAGEANAPLAALIGDDPEKPHLLTVSEPRDRTQRFAWAADLAAVVLPYVDSFADAEIGEDDTYRDAPQLLVPNPADVGFTRLLGRSTRFRKTQGEYAAPESVPLLGRWLTFFSERSEVPASALLLSLTGALTAHWATGQSATEDGHLAALLAWIDPPEGMTGAEAALEAEDPDKWPPAGPVTHPDFDNDILQGRVMAVRGAARAGDEAALNRAQARLTEALRSQLEPTWSLMWRGVELLRTLTEAEYLAKRWEADRWHFTNHVRWLAEGGAPQARRDNAVRAAQRLNSLERDQQWIEVKAAFEDPLVMAEQRMSGEALAGEVVDRDPARLDTTGKRPRLRPRITLSTTDTAAFERGAKVRSPARPKQDAVVVGIEPADDGRTRVTVELTSGMGRSLTPQPGSVPEAGEFVVYTTLTGEFQPGPKWPEKEDTPWTHGGPPPEYVPNDEDAGEAWA
ncbi:MAG: hypothetical protein ACRDN0_06175 [Trebonia sp.]